MSLPASADESVVPVQLQVDLTAKVLDYAQEPPVREAPVLRIGILTRVGTADSERFGELMKTAFDRIHTIAGVASEQSTIAYAGPGALVDECKRRQLLVVYLTPGLAAEVPAIAEAMQDMPVITIAADGSYVPSGAILGFELVSGHPKMVFNLRQAQRQKVAFRSAVMKLMRLVE